MEIEIHFTHEPIVAPPPVLPSREIGACVGFQGLVRELEQGQALAGLHYEAYQPMAGQQMRRIFEELGAAHPCASVYFIHRLGWVPVGEVSIFIRVLASHRREALAVCGEAIDRMKQDVPIWKVGGRGLSAQPD
jgi:molybdopterin synthase catalytic subunit